ncbi:acyltransferase family protein [Alkalihalobacillus hemicellulosilyticus]|uniref:Acyltransferase 3 domain-containing protein n=1 Tax=Halalkalibacter hemicellulosilyticusJCM 9152 TaxID=1236971 RepID=W4QEN9_9BACI|nr:acyltransferase family protein [Halalkalibacter hemicellulosilyticus]GAE30516.1 hypothetical protein JCM9152_1924 [Halalkalibacter hemicellulosilyticusJCM 9152]
MKKRYVGEIGVLRSIACLSIVLLHSIMWGMEYIGFLRNLPRISQQILDSVNLFLYYGTPTFIFITAFILGYQYENRDVHAKSFLRKRLTFILIPYFCMAILYATPYALISPMEFIRKASLNLLIGDFHAYFVLIIFQFYLLFVLFKKYFTRYSSRMILTTTFIINVTYLAVFNFTPPADVPAGDYIWTRFYWVPFFGWIFYFAVAYYVGVHYEKVLNLLKKYKLVVIIAPFVTGAIILYLYHSNTFTVHSSKRVDMVLHTLSIIAFLLLLTQSWTRIPKWLLLINDYSFGIYLLHTLYMSILIVIINLFQLDFGIFTIILLFFGSLFFSIWTIYVCNQFKFGPYVVGRINQATRR